MADFFRYYKRFFVRWGKELWSFGREQVVGVILAVLILLFQIYKGLIPEKDAALTAKATVLWPYLALIGIYVAVHLVRTPWKLDQEMRAQLERQTSQKEVKCQIELLTQLTDRGQDFIRRCRGNKDLVPHDEVETWAGEVVAIVQAVFDNTYVSRLESSVGMPMGAAYWPNLENRHVDGFVHVRVYRLQEFIDELRDHLKGMRQ